MAKKTRTPEEQRRIEERIAFVQANPQLSKAEARKRFYVQTRARELQAQGKEVNRQALRQKFEMGQVTRAGFYTESDIAASQARIRSSANPMPRNNDTGRSNVTPGYTPGVQGGVKIPGQRTGRETGPGTGSFVTGRPTPAKKAQSKSSFDTSKLKEALIDPFGSTARSMEKTIDMATGKNLKIGNVKPFDNSVANFVRNRFKEIPGIGTSEMWQAESLQRSIVNNPINFIAGKFGKKPNLKGAGKVETTVNIVGLALTAKPQIASKTYEFAKGLPLTRGAVGRVEAVGGRVLGGLEKVGSKAGSNVKFTKEFIKNRGVVNEAATVAENTAAKAATKAATKGTKKGAAKAAKTPATTPVPNTPAPAPGTAAKPKTTRTTKAKPASKTATPSPQARAQEAVDANKAARNTGTGRASEAPAPQAPQQPAAQTPSKSNDVNTIVWKGQEIDIPHGTPGLHPLEARAGISPAEATGRAPTPEAVAKAKASRAARNTGTGRANEAPAAPAQQTADWWSDQGGKLNTDLRNTGGTVASQQPAAASQPTRKTGTRKKVELPENLQGKSVAIGSEERKAAEEAADAYLGKKQKKSTSTAKTKTQVENQAAKPAPQPRLPKAKNTGGGRGQATSLDQVTFRNPAKLVASLKDPRMQDLFMSATREQQLAWGQRHGHMKFEFEKLLQEDPQAREIFKKFGQSAVNNNPAPRGQAPSAPTPTQSSRMDTGERGTGRANYQSAEIDDMSVGGYEVIERTPPPAPAKKAGKTKKAAPAKKTAPAQKAAPAKREPQVAPSTVNDTMDARAVQRERDRVESEIKRIKDREKTLNETRGRGLSEEDINKLDELRIKHKKLTDSLAQFNVKIQKETDKAARIGGTRD